jgi:hypothetical protein
MAGTGPPLDNDSLRETVPTQTKGATSMTGTTTATRPNGGTPAAFYRRINLVGVVLAIVLAAAAVPLMGLLEGPSFVDRLSVENPTRYDIGIDVTDADRDGWMAIGTARRATSSTFEEIIDQGDVWIFRFRAQGEDGGELRVTRQELEGDGWKLTIPESVGDDLQAKGAAFPP